MNGYSSNGCASPDLKTPIVLTADLGSVQSFNQVSIFSRNSFESTKGGARCFPKDYSIAVSKDGESFVTVADIVDCVDPHMHQLTYNFDEVDARYVKLTFTKLGEPEMTVPPEVGYRLQLAEIEIAKITDN